MGEHLGGQLGEPGLLGHPVGGALDVAEHEITDQAMRDALEATKGYVGTGSIINMSATDHMGLDLSAFRMLEVKGGDWSLVK